MIDLNRDGFESQLIAAFARGSAPVSDHGFTRRVLTRLRRRRLVRGCVLGIAWVAGGLLTGMATAALLPSVTAAAVDLLAGWREADWLAGYQTLLVGVLGGAAIVGLTGLLEE